MIKSAQGVDFSEDLVIVLCSTKLDFLDLQGTGKCMGIRTPDIHRTAYILPSSLFLALTTAPKPPLPCGHSATLFGEIQYTTHQEFQLFPVLFVS